jgi:hypothetical protein
MPIFWNGYPAPAPSDIAFEQCTCPTITSSAPQLAFIPFFFFSLFAKMKTVLWEMASTRWESARKRYDCERFERRGCDGLFWGQQAQGRSYWDSRVRALWCSFLFLVTEMGPKDEHSFYFFLLPIDAASYYKAKRNFQRLNKKFCW